MTVAKKAAHRGEHEVRRKAIAWGMSECSPLNLYASVPFLCARAHETAGAARTPAPPRPLIGAKRSGKTRAQCAAGMKIAFDVHARATYSLVIAGLDRATQYAAVSRLNHCTLWNTGSPG